MAGDAGSKKAFLGGEPIEISRDACMIFGCSVSLAVPLTCFEF